MTRPLHAAVLALTVSALAVACSQEQTTSSEAVDRALRQEAVAAPATPQADVARLRRALAPFQRFDLATTPGGAYADRITPCWYHGRLGAMGYHWADAKRIDGTVDALAPEALVYEPLPGGHQRLVAAEYIVPIAAWKAANPPALYGRAFDRNDGLGLYVMHVWAWIDNPAGMFAPWNPNVTCNFAAESEDRGAAH